MQSPYFTKNCSDHDHEEFYLRTNIGMVIPVEDTVAKLLLVFLLHAVLLYQKIIVNNDDNNTYTSNQ